MALTFRIFPKRGLVVVRYVGASSIDETMQVFGAYTQHPDYAPGQKQLIDFSRATGYDKNYARILEMQAIKAEHMADPATQSLMVCLAPTPIALEMATLLTRSWEDVSSVVPLVLRDEAEALDVLGQPEREIAALFAAEDRDALQ